MAIIELLNLNKLESTVEIYNGKNIHQLVEEIRSEIVNGQALEEETRRKIGILY